jgi:phosphatidylglycerophosphate synthase
MTSRPSDDDWRIKPTDRFVLRWIKCHLSARITPRLCAVAWVRPWMATLGAVAAGVLSGALFAAGWGGPAGLWAAVSQVLDGVDGQMARLTGRQSALGAFLDSVLDRYGDGAMVLGLLAYSLGPAGAGPVWAIWLLGFLALSGTGLVSYSSARAEGLNIPLGGPTLASKGTRVSAVAVGGLGSVLWPWLPEAVLVYLAVHTNGVVLWRVARAWQAATRGGGT